MKAHETKETNKIYKAQEVHETEEDQECHNVSWFTRPSGNSFASQADHTFGREFQECSSQESSSVLGCSCNALVSNPSPVILLSEPNKLIVSLRQTWVDLCLLSVISAPSGVKRHFFTSSQEKSRNSNGVKHSKVGLMMFPLKYVSKHTNVMILLFENVSVDVMVVGVHRSREDVKAGRECWVAGARSWQITFHHTHRK